MLNYFNGPTIGLFANDDLPGEVKGILFYIIAPLVIGSLFVRLCIYVRMSWLGSKWLNSSPAAISVMVGTLLLFMVPVIADVSTNRANSVGTIIAILSFALYLELPLFLMIGLLLLFYVGRLAQGDKPPSLLIVYSLCAASIVVEYFYLIEALSR
jgi:hypothetical protein